MNYSILQYYRLRRVDCGISVHLSLLSRQGWEIDQEWQLGERVVFPTSLVPIRNEERVRSSQRNATKWYSRNEYRSIQTGKELLIDTYLYTDLIVECGSQSNRIVRETTQCRVITGSVFKSSRLKIKYCYEKMNGCNWPAYQQPSWSLPFNTPPTVVD